MQKKEISKVFWCVGRWMSILIRPLFFLLSTIIPKNKKIWVFGAWFGMKYSDNSKHLYNYVTANHKEIIAVWICKDKKLVNKLRNSHINAYYYCSFPGMWYQCRAGFIFVTHAIYSDLNTYCISPLTKRIQLWHGVPLKKIGYDDQLVSKVWKKFKLYKFVCNENYDLVISPGDKISKQLSSAFDVSLDKIVDSGLPRNDVFLKKNKSSGSRFRVIYMPTLRGTLGDEVRFLDSVNLEKISEILDKNRIDLYLRIHPANRPSTEIQKNIERYENIKWSAADDIYDEINDYDCLITDYSSIMFDYALSKRPIILFPFDLDDYLIKNRSLYFDYNVISSGFHVKTWDGVIAALIDIKEKNIKASEYNLLSFFSYPEGSSCERLYMTVVEKYGV